MSAAARRLGGGAAAAWGRPRVARLAAAAAADTPPRLHSSFPLPLMHACISGTPAAQGRKLDMTLLTNAEAIYGPTLLDERHLLLAGGKIIGILDDDEVCGAVVALLVWTLVRPVSGPPDHQPWMPAAVGLFRGCCERAH